MGVQPRPVLVVEILGAEYRLDAEGDPDQLAEVARYVDRRMRELAMGGNPVPLGRVGVLAALNIAEELFRERAERRRNDEERRRIEEEQQRNAEEQRRLDGEREGRLDRLARRLEDELAR